MRTPLQKRPNDLFVSYGHADVAVVQPVVDWLRRSAGLKLWHDNDSGNAAQRTTDLLDRGLGSARGALFCLSRQWSESTWCQDELEIALTERSENSDYVVVAAQVADGEIPRWLTRSQVIDVRTLDVRSGTALLRSLAPSRPNRTDNDQDVYYAGPWSSQSAAVRRAVQAFHEMGWRLIGDSPDNSEYADSIQRITALIKSSRGLLAVLPFRREDGFHRTSPWVLDEVRIARDLGRPYLLVAEQGVLTPPDLAADAYGGRALPLTGAGPDAELLSMVQSFDDDMLAHVEHSDERSYSFLAASLLGSRSEMDALVAVVEGVTNMRCVQGQYLTGQHAQHAQDAIVRQIRGAAFMIADITDDSRNSLIEAGIARGAGVPLHLMCPSPENGNFKTRFMLQDLEINWYTDPLERIGAAYRIARRYRRRVLAP
jgi:hypothetical protein